MVEDRRQKICFSWAR